MTRRVLNGVVGVDLTAVDTNPSRGIREQVDADSGVYIYAQANGAITAGHICRIDETGQADTITTTESGSIPVEIGVAVATLADNEYGWFWRGKGVEEVFVLASHADATAITTHTVTGVGSTGGDAIHSLISTEARGGTNGVITCHAAGLLSTNAG